MNVAGVEKLFSRIIFKATGASTFTITKFAKGFKAFSLTLLHLETQKNSMKFKINKNSRQKNYSFKKLASIL